MIPPGPASLARSDTIEDLIAETRDVPKVIFHCALSRKLSSRRSGFRPTATDLLSLAEERGPKMARVYAEEMERRGAREQVAREKKEQESAGADLTETGSKDGVATDKPAKQEVLVLQGGFTRW